MKHTRSTQQGISLTAILFILVIAGTALTILFRLGPLYLNHLTLKSIMESVANAPEPYVGGKHAILDKLTRNMEINELRAIDPKVFTFERRDDGTFDVKANYERREHLFFNVDAVLVFEHEVKVKGK